MAAVWDSRTEGKGGDGASRAPQRAGMIAAAVLHALAAMFLLSYEPARTALLEAAPIMVELITPPQPEKIQPPKIKPVPVVQPKPVQKPVETPLLVAAAETPTPVVAPPPPPPVAAPAITPAPAVPSAAIQAATPTPAQITPPMYNAPSLNNPALIYPPQSQRRGEQGRGMLRVYVNTGGRADQVQLLQSSGFSRLDESAIESVKQWKFIPARQGNQAIAEWVRIPFAFVWAPI